MTPTPTYKYSVGRYRGARKFMCLDCEYDCLVNESTMVDHCRFTGHGVFEQPSLKQVVAEAEQSPLTVMITLFYLCWNTRLASVEGALELIRERDRLIQLGARAEVFILDNGSTDGTYDAINAATADNLPDLLIHLPVNVGSSVSRNFAIDLSLRNGSDYLALLDGDIEVVPYSMYAMAKYLECHCPGSPDPVGCIGAYSASFSDNRSQVDTRMALINDARVKGNIQCAWTQYGLFRTEMFKRGVCFDVSGPFATPGWGYEDDDLYWQMHEKGYACRYFRGMTYLHRALHSSWKSMRDEGIDPRDTCYKRRDYLVSKWTARGLDPAILNHVRAQQFPGE